eukprot:scaffold91516_cov58-Phaeocystis_antarctica.AAC.3
MAWMRRASSRHVELDDMGTVHSTTLCAGKYAILVAQPENNGRRDAAAAWGASGVAADGGSCFPLSVATGPVSSTSMPRGSEVFFTASFLGHVWEEERERGPILVFKHRDLLRHCSPKTVVLTPSNISGSECETCSKVQKSIKKRLSLVRRRRCAVARRSGGPGCSGPSAAGASREGWRLLPLPRSWPRCTRRRTRSRARGFAPGPRHAHDATPLRLGGDRRRARKVAPSQVARAWWPAVWKAAELATSAGPRSHSHWAHGTRRVKPQEARVDERHGTTRPTLPT